MATGSQVGAWLLVEVDGAWGADAVHDSELGSFVPADFKDTMRRRGIRVVCIRRLERRGMDEVRLFLAVVHRPPHRGLLLERTVASLAEVAEIGLSLSRDDQRPPGWEVVGERLVLVCTNGRHDQCCANEGRPVIRALRTTTHAERVWESSHVGGDRFAANIVILPDSLYFGRCVAETAADLIDEVDGGVLNLTHFRGRSSYRLEEQAIEHRVREELGVSGIDAVRIGAVDGDGRYPVTVVEGDAEGQSVRRFLVGVRRRMTLIADPVTCHGTPNQRTPVFDVGEITPA